MKINKLIFITLALLVGIIIIFKLPKISNLPVIAIANYGPHSSLNATIAGIQNELIRNGYEDNKNIKIEIADVNFDTSLIPQMISKFKDQRPKVVVAMSTPVAQYAKSAIKNTPLIYTVVTDPVEAGLLKSFQKSEDNVTGSSDKQDLKLMLEFAKKLLPSVKKVGLLYSTSEANDNALVKMMKQAALTLDIEVVAIPVAQSREAIIAMQNFRNVVDFIYVGTSGAIQPALPLIVSESNKMNIPIINVDEDAVKDGLVLASFGVNYEKVGANTAKQIIEILKGNQVSNIAPIYPATEDHEAYINKKQALKFAINIPEAKGLEIVE